MIEINLRKPSIYSREIPQSISILVFFSEKACITYIVLELFLRTTKNNYLVEMVDRLKMSYGWA